MKKNKASNDPINKVWKYFASIKLTITLLIILAITCIIGTLIPQNESSAAYFLKYGEFICKVFSALDIFDMYHSWWFQLLVFILTANIIVCSIDRLSSTWKVIFKKTPTFDIAKLKSSYKEEFNVAHTPAELKAKFTTALSRLFKYTRIEDKENGFVIYAEKGRWSRLGVYAVHFSVILLLIGGLIGSYFGFDGSVTIPEGKSVKNVILRNTGDKQPLGFEIRCDDFNVTFYKSGMPKEYRSALTILENGKPVLKKDIIVNDPLRYKGINVFQSNYGMQAPEDISLSFTDRKTGTVYRKKISVEEEIDLPGISAKFVLNKYFRSYNFRGHNLGEAFVGTLTPLKGEPADIILPINYPGFDKMRGGEIVISAENTEKRYYTGLQVTRDPGVRVVYSGFILMIIGCFITFFVSHIRFCVEVVEKHGKSIVIIAGNSNKNIIGMEASTKKIAKLLSKKV
ncbi:MAG: cytochrome c biogenesis protein ResB [Proteobacteria bacterium]|nr:cytochrome c biogenesis protein ResB [Pseudomonadota bacterium]